MKEREKRFLQEQTHGNDRYAEYGVKHEAGEQHPIDPVVILVGVVLRDVFHKRRAETEIQPVQRERIHENAEQDPRAELAHVEMRKNVRRQQQRESKTPGAAEQIEKRVGDELLRELPF